MISYWEQKTLLAYDTLIVGGGIVGLSTAISLAERMPAMRIGILERGLLPTGASSRNAGFACMGSPTELLADLETSTEGEVQALFALRMLGLQKLRNRYGDPYLGYRANGSHLVLQAHEADEVVPKLDYLNGLLMPIVGRPAFALGKKPPATYGLAGDAHTLVECLLEGQLDTGTMLATMMRHAASLGILMHTGAEVLGYEKSHVAKDIVVQVGTYQLRCQQLVFCTNAFTPRFFPSLDIAAGRGQILVTEPIPGLLLKGVFHLDAGYTYFRELDGRVLIGGGRNIDFKGEATDQFGLNPKIGSHLRQLLTEMILPHQAYKVEYEWSGIMAFGQDKAPIIEQVEAGVFLAVRMGGMGVAIGTEVGELAADLVVKSL